MKKWAINSESFGDHTTLYEGEGKVVQIARPKGAGKEPAIPVDGARNDPQVGARMRLFEQARSIAFNS
jgi:hypothetical protein